MRGAFLRRGAPCKFEIADTCTPVKAGSGSVVLIGIVKRAVIHWINGDIAVIAPAIGGAGLAAGAVKKMLFSRQRVQWIGGEPACVPNLRIN